MRFERKQLANGLTIIGEVNPAAASMALGFFVRTGSRDEWPAVAGVSHFLEHMLFKGTDRRDSHAINRDFDQMGAVYNAFTSEENTVYFGAVLPEFQKPLLDLLSDMMRPALRADDFTTEKKVILEEIALYDDRPRFRLYEKLLGVHFGEHALSHSVLGTRDSIQALRREDMLHYFGQRYSPGNLTLVGVGNVDWDALVAQAQAACGAWPAFEVGRDTPPCAGTLATQILTDPKLVRQHVALMSPAPDARDERRYAAGLLAMVLGDSTGSRLFYALVDPAIAEDASCGYDEFDGAGALITYLCADPDRAGQALAIARAEYARFMAGGATEGELLAAKNKVAAAATLKGELPMGRFTTVGFDWIYRGAYVPLDEWIDRTLAVTLAEVNQVAHDYDLTQATLVALGPKEAL